MAMEIQVLDDKIIVGENALREMKKLQEFQVTIQEMKNEETEIKNALFAAMEKAGVKKFENEFITVTAVAPTTYKSVDSKLLEKKHPKIYKEVLKDNHKKGYVRIEYKEDK